MLRELQRIGVVGVARGGAALLHPVEVDAGTEAAAVAEHDQHARFRFGGQVLERRHERVGEFGIDRVGAARTVDRDPGDAGCIDGVVERFVHGDFAGLAVRSER